MFRRPFRTSPSHDRRWFRRPGPVGLALALVAAPLALLQSPAASHTPPLAVDVTAAVTTDPADAQVYRVDTVSMPNSETSNPCSGGSFKTPGGSPLGVHDVAPGVTVSVTGNKTAGYTVEIDDTFDGEARLTDVYLKGAVDDNSWYHFHPSVLSATPLFTSDREPERADASHMWFCFDVTGSLTITKNVVRGAGESFGFTVDCESYALESGDAAFSLSTAGQHLIDGLPIGTECTVSETDPGASSWTTSYRIDGGEPQSALTTSAVTIGPGNQTVAYTNSRELAEITVHKVVDIGTASATQWCFNITPNPNDVTLPLCPDSEESTVTFAGLQTGSYTITETMTVAGYTFASGSGSNCTFAGSTATASVTTGVVPQDASCTFHNASAPPTVRVVKTAAPASLPEPGGDFTFTVDVTNTSSTETVTVTSLNDDVYGDLALMSLDCADLIGDILVPNATGTCLFTGNFTGDAGDNETDTVTVVVTDDDDTTATDDDDATVTLTNVAPTVTVVKTASPSSLPAPGGDFAYTVVITNTSGEAVTITSLTDSIYDWTAVVGDCDDLVGDTLAAGASVTCTFTGTFTGTAGDRETDVVTVVVTDNDDSTATHLDDATVTLGPAPVIAAEVAGVTLTAAPVQPAAELPRTGSREMQPQLLLALGLVLLGVSFRVVTRRRGFHSV